MNYSYEMLAQQPLTFDVKWTDYVNVLDSGMWIGITISILVAWISDGIFYWFLRPYEIETVVWDPAEMILSMFASILCIQGRK